MEKIAGENYFWPAVSDSAANHETQEKAPEREQNKEPLVPPRRLIIGQ